MIKISRTITTKNKRLNYFPSTFVIGNEVIDFAVHIKHLRIITALPAVISKQTHFKVVKRKLHYFDLLWLCCSTIPRQIEVMEFALKE